MQLDLQQRLWVLRNFFTIYLERAHDLVKAGRKDDARDWLRFFRNSGILGLLADVEHGVLAKQENEWLSCSLRDLETKCHPLDVPNFQTDLQAIRGQLEQIGGRLGLLFHSDLKIDSVGNCVTP
ncbi:MAG TPA: hypothetical protein VIK59_03000 [Verrucomicrobiae bacterium]